MPLRPETNDIPLTGGLNLDNDKSLPAGDFSVLDNADFDPVRKRHGHTKYNVWENGRQQLSSLIGPLDGWAYGHGRYLSNATLGGEQLNYAEVGDIRGVAAMDDALLAWDGSRLYQYDETPSSGWHRIGGEYGNAFICHAQETQNIVVSPSAKHYDVAVGKYRTMYVWVEDTTAYYSIVSNDSGSPIVQRQTLSTSSPSAVHPKAVYLTTDGQDGGTFLVGVDDSTSVNYYYTRIPELNHELSAEGQLLSNRCANDQPVDIRVHNGKAYFLYTANDGGSNFLRLVTMNQAGSTEAFELDDDGNTPEDSEPVGLGIHPDGTVMAAWCTSAPTIRCAFYGGNDMGLLYTPVNVGSVEAHRLTCSPKLLKSAGEYEGAVAWWVLASSTVSLRNVSGDGTSLSALSMIDCELTHQMMRIGQTVAITVGYRRSSTLQYQMVTLAQREGALSNTLVPVAASLRGTWYPAASQHHWTYYAAPVPDDEYRFALTAETARLLPTATSLQQIKDGAASVELDFLPPLRTARVGQSLWFAGGVVQEFDGATFHEAGFLTYPQPSGALVAGGSLPTTGAPQYRVYLIRRNAKGELHRSAAISLVGPTPTGGNLTVRLTLPAVPFMTHDNAQWEIYRQDYGTSVFKRLATVDVNISTARSADTTYDDTGATSVTDKAVDPAPSYAANGLGTLDRICPPSCTIIAAGKERIWFAGGGVPNRQVAYSRLFDPDESAAWNEALLLSVPGDGAVTGLGFLGDWVIALRPLGVYVAGGAGPDNLGVGEFDVPRLVNSEIGCVSPDSVVLLPMGLAFQTSGGVALLPHSLGVLPIGESVRSALTEDNPVTSVAVSAIWKQARFATESGVYVLDYSAAPRWTLWTVPTNHMCQYRGRIAVAADNSAVLVEQSEDENTGDDGIEGYDFLASTGWLRPGAAGGLNNFDWWYLVGTWQGPGDIYARVDFDYRIVGPTVDERIWSPIDPYTPAQIGSETPATIQDHGQADLTDTVFGSGNPTFYATFGNLDIRRRFKRRRASAIKYTFRTVGAGKGPSFDALSVEYRPDIGMRGL